MLTATGSLQAAVCCSVCSRGPAATFWTPSAIRKFGTKRRRERKQTLWSIFYTGVPDQIANYEFGPVVPLPPPAIPAGAVVAFVNYMPDHCPSGWEPSLPTRGRLILGAGGARPWNSSTGLWGGPRPPPGNRRSSRGLHGRSPEGFGQGLRQEADRG